LVGFADVHRHPFAVSEEFRPTVVAVNAAVIPLRRDRGTDGEAGRNAKFPRQRDEVGVKIRAVAASGVAGINRVTASPSWTVFGVAQLFDHVVIKRAGASQVSRFSPGDLLGNCAKGFVRGY